MNVPEPFHVLGDHIAIELPGTRAVFTRRRGGVSEGPYESLNLGRLTDDRVDAVARNRELLRRQLGVPMAMIRQVHGAEVRRLAAAPHPGDGVPEADGQATAIPGIGVMVMTADCLPVAVAGRGAVAMLHAGWRGLAAGIVAEGVRAVSELGAEGPLHAAIGPGAGPCCYEVGHEVRGAFAGPGVPVSRTLDLKAIARRQLEQSGVEAVHDVGLCTICNPAAFYSHRRERGITGRQAGVAWLS